METKSHAKTNATDSRDENLTCWRTATSPQCLRVETTSEIHLFPYGYFQHANFTQESGKDVLQIHFQDRIIIIKGKRLESLYDALGRFAVERIRMLPEKYEILKKTEGYIEIVEIKSLPG